MTNKDKPRSPKPSQPVNKRVVTGCLRFIGFAFVGLVVIFLVVTFVLPIFGGGAPQINLPHAKPYKIYQQDFFGKGFGQHNVKLLITSKQPQTADGFAQTAMQAVVDVMEKDDFDFVRVWLYGADKTNTNTQNYQFLLAMASYDNTKNKWENLMAKPRRLTRDEVWIAKNWHKFRTDFMEDGLVNELKLKTFLFEGMQKTKVLTQEMKDKYPSAKKIHLPSLWIGETKYKIPDD